MKIFAVIVLLLAYILQSCKTQSCRNHTLRLVNGDTEYEGRVEICVGGQWGTVCDDLWDRVDAGVVCAQLGYGRRDAVAFYSAHFGRGTGSIHLDNVRCNGAELMLINCPHPPVGIHNCYHGEDAGVRCQPLSACVHGDLRLIGGGDLEGRVEVCLNDQWGTVCDDFWGTEDASVVCKQLGYSRFNASAFSYARFGRGSGSILMDDVRCTGSEGRLIDCRYDSNTGDCSHFEDASVRCVRKVCSDGDVRLLGGSVPNEGRVEICFNETWGTVCDDFWSTNDAKVVCRQLGFSTNNVAYFSRARFGTGSGPIYLDDVGCIGSELGLVNCSHSRHTADCTHSEDAGVRCQTNLHCRDGDIRLAGARRTKNEGRVEVCLNEEWGTVCDDGWGVSDATVACKQLGYSRYNATAYNLARYGQGSGAIHLDDVACRGSEDRLIDCRHVSFHNCLHLEDASVRCSNKTCRNGDLRLVGGQSQLEGRVEVCWNETWGTVCDGGWSPNDAKVACRQLGFSQHSVTTFINAHFGQGTGPILLDDLTCTGTESRLVDCTHDGIGQYDSCTHADDAGVRCRERNCSNGDLRLVGGLSQYEGRVEVCWNETWGTVCDDFWGSSDAQVVCRQLGYNSQLSNVQAFSTAWFGRGSGPILLDDVFCRGDETRLVMCPHRTIGQHNCGHYEDAGVRCSQCVENSVRLVGGSTQCEGRVEICLSGRWGTVCDDGWDNRDAGVVCRQLGYSTQNAQSIPRARYGQGTAPIVMDSAQCRGSELRLASCTYLNVNNLRSCSHSEDAGVHCQPVTCHPQNVRFTARSSTALSISWSPPPITQRCGAILRYSISCLDSGILQLNQTTDNSTFSARMVGLRPYTNYSCCISAITTVAEGKSCVNNSTSEAVPAIAPAIGVARRLSATSIEISWDPLSVVESQGVVTAYSVRYRKVERVTRRNVDDISTIVETTNTSIVITDLEPNLRYAVSVAAKTSAGVGNYSDEVTLGLFHNSPFQLHLSGAILCLDWLLDGPSEKVNVISEIIARELMGICTCTLSAKYIADTDLICVENSMDQVVFQGRLISTDDMNSTDIILHLEHWAQTEPTVVAKGVQLTVSNLCSVHLEELGQSGCTTVNTPSSTTPTEESQSTETPTIEVITPMKESSVVPISAGVIGGVLFLIVIVVALIVVVVVLRRRQSKMEMNPAHIPALSRWEPQASVKGKACASAGLATEKPCMWEPGSQGDDEHIYDIIPEYQKNNLNQNDASAYSYCSTVRHASTSFGLEPANYSQLNTDEMPRLEYTNVGTSAAIPNSYAPFPRNPYSEPVAPIDGTVPKPEQDEYIEMVSETPR